MSKRKIGFLTGLLMLLFLACSMTTMAAYPTFTEANPMIGYGWRQKEYKVYSTPELTEQVTKLSYRACKITAILDGAAQITYSDKKGTTEKGWVSLKEFIYNPEYPHQPSYANATFQIYKRPTISASYVSVAQFSGGLTVSERGSWVQVLFHTGGKYRLGWMKKTNYQSYVRLSMDTTTQILANGTYTISPASKSTKGLEYQEETGRFSFAKKKQTRSQKFKLQYVSNNYYLISPMKTGENLAEKEKVTLDPSNSYMWKIIKRGQYYYLRAKESGNGLSYKNGKLTTEKFQMISEQKWMLTKTKEAPVKETSVVFSQYDPKWGGYAYYKGPTLRTISTSGCGVMALTNAIYALNGEFIPPEKLASFSASRGHYFYNQGTADTLYKDFAKKYGVMYHFKHQGKTYSLSNVRNQLKKGGVAVALVPGHYIAIVAYRASDNHYLVLDSAIYGKRPTTIYGDWVPASTLGSGTMRCEYYHLFSRR